MQIKNLSKTFQSFENSFSHIFAKEHYHQFVENFSEISKRHFARTTRKRFRIKHCEEETQNDCSIEIFEKSDST
jgi:hypothetical protein